MGCNLLEVWIWVNENVFVGILSPVLLPSPPPCSISSFPPPVKAISQKIGL